MKKRIAIIGSRGYPIVYSGYETLITALCNELKNDFEITIYCHAHLFEHKPDKENGIKLVYVNGLKGKSTAQFSISLLSFIHCLTQRYDSILVVNAANGIFGIFRYFISSKLIINVDGLEWLRPKWKGLGGKFFKLSAKLACRWYDIVITDADAMRKIYLDTFKRDSVVIEYGAYIPEGITTKGLLQWNVNKEDYFLIVGRLIPDNNADIILKAFLKSKTTKKLIIVGDVPYADLYAESIKELAAHDKRVVMTGYVKDQDELKALYQNCYFYFHGHEFGGTNPTILKALAYGCPIIAIDTVFSAEVLDNYKYGIPFKKDIQSLAFLIDELEEGIYDEKRLVLKETGKVRIKERYTWNRITSMYANLFNS
jgi:glycosyltransferase involved in cell wall biosynthesis